MLSRSSATVASLRTTGPHRAIALLMMIVWAALTLPAHGEDWYQVEVIVFDHRNSMAEERPQLAVQLSYPGNWQQLIDPNAPTPNDPTSSPAATAEAHPTLDDALESVVAQERPFTLITTGERRLNNDANRLDRSGSYRVLFHQAWRQPLGNRARAPWVLIRGGDTYGEHHELEGALRIYLQRALFAQANLWRADFGTTETGVPDSDESLVLPPWPARHGGENPLFETLAREAAQAERPADTDWLDLESLAPTRTADHYPVRRIAALSQTQRLELGETLYLDHPRFGVLVHVTRHQSSDDASASDPESP